jgi:2-dehydro-3-deoxyphosphogluconate aldolase/(4S)-4-hydroxy-2-oxoglutarate aldolase
MGNNKSDIESLLARASIIPVLALDDPGIAVELAQALVAGGLPVIEVTLRSPRATEVLKKMASVKNAIVGAGTILTAEQADMAISSGAKFLVSPGATPKLLDAAEKFSISLLPGVATSSEIMQVVERGYRFLKFFPAEPAGGVATLKSFAGPFPQIKFCPTGGIDAEKAKGYLALPNVICVGGSFVTPESLVSTRDWSRITALAKSVAR